MIWDITPDQAAPVTHPSRPFAPQRSIVAYAVPDTLQCCVALPRRKALILHLPGRLGVGDRHGGGPIPITREFICAKSVCRDGGCARRSYRQKLTSALVHAWFSPHHSLLVENYRPIATCKSISLRIGQTTSVNVSHCTPRSRQK